MTDKSAEFVKNNRIALRTCMIWESLKSRQNGKAHPSFSAYQNFCKVIGDDLMKFSEFDFWYHRFLNGEFDLNFERDKDKKIHELTDMPIVVMENIVKHLDFFDRVALEKTSRSLRTFVKNQKLFLDTIQFHIQSHTTGILLPESANPEYIDGERRWFRKSKPSNHQFRRLYWEEATRGLKKIFNYPRLYLDTLEAYFVWDNRRLITVSSTLWEELDTPIYQLNLKKLDVRVASVKILLKLLPYFTPGYLTTIDIDTSEPNTPDELEELVELEQWKQAKYSSTKGALLVPLRYFYHFQKFSARLEELSVEDLREMKEILFNSPVFEKCSLALNEPVDIGQEFGDAIPGSTNIYHHSIPDSDEYFEIKVEWRNIEILRKKK